MDLEPKHASLWWTSTYAFEEKEDMILGTSKGCYKFPFEDELKILGCMMNRQGKTCDAVGERIRSANEAFWKDIKIHRNKDIPRRIKCQRLVDHVFPFSSFGGETWMWTQQTLKNSKGGRPKI